MTKRNKITVSLLSIVLMMTAASAFAAGPLILFDAPTPTPYAYPGLVGVYTDNDPMFSLTGPVTGADQDARVADASASWSGVPTSSLNMGVIGDFASIGLPDIDLSNFNLVIGTDNGGGYHIIYDHDGSIVANLAGPGVLGFSSPEFANAGTPDLTESYAVLNGATVGPGDTQGLWWQGVTTHEMGHGINLAHVQVNGAIGFFGDDIGPAGCAPPYGGGPLLSEFETMYPFLDPSYLTGSGVEQGTIDQLDDRSSVSDVYPGAGWPSNFGTIAGVIFRSDGVTPVTGVNVMVRNLADPFGDCMSHVSGDFTQGQLGPDGRYTFNGLTPGQTYLLYIDQIVAGGFSTPPANPFPGPEEWYNGVNESGDPSIDDKCDYVGLTVANNQTINANVIANLELVLGDDDSQEVPLPFAFNFCGTLYTSVWVGSNGFVTFGQGNTDFSESAADLQSGPPRIAPLWDDLNPSAGGTVDAAEISGNFVISWNNIPEFGTTNSNTFVLTLRPDDTYHMDFPGHDAVDGLTGNSSVGNGLSNDPGEVDLSVATQPISGAAGDMVYEWFQASDNDLSGSSLDWSDCQGFQVVIELAQMNVCYASTGASDGGNLYTVDDFTGATTLLGPSGRDGVPGLAINSFGEIWGTERITGSLYRIDGVSGQAFFQTATDIGFLDGIAFDANDVLYGIGFDPPNFQLRTIDLATGVTTPIGPTGDVYVGLAFHPGTGVLYASVGGFQPVNPDGIATINTTTGAATILGTTGLDGATPDLCFDQFGNLFASKGGGNNPNNLILVSQVDGSGLIVGPMGVQAVSGMAAWVAFTVPTTIQAFHAMPGAASVDLEWDVNADVDLIGFRLHRREASGAYRSITDVMDGGDRSFTDQAVAPNKTYFYRLEAVVSADYPVFSQEVEVRTRSLALALEQNHPNPFNPTTTIRYTVPERAIVTLQVFDAAGRRVAMLVNDTHDAGRFESTWTGRNDRGQQVSSGIYFYRLQVGNQAMTKKMVLLK